MSALDLPGRAIVVHADFTDLAALRKMAFQTSRPIRVHALLPPRFESNGKGDAIRSSFLHAGPWRHEPLPGSEYRCVGRRRPPIASSRVMRRVLMVSPHFPPDSSAASHRVRLLAPYLPDAGWQPTIVTRRSRRL